MLLAELASAAAQGVDLTDRISYLGNFVFQVKLYDNRIGAWVSQNVTFNGTLSQDSTEFYDPTPRTGDPATGVSEFWPLLFQRAYLEHFYNIDPMNTAALYNFNGELFHDQAAAAVTGRSARVPAAEDLSAPRCVRHHRCVVRGFHRGLSKLADATGRDRPCC